MSRPYRFKSEATRQACVEAGRQPKDRERVIGQPIRLCMHRPTIADMVRACQRAGVKRAKIVIGLAAYYDVPQKRITEVLWGVDMRSRMKGGAP